METMFETLFNNLQVAVVICEATGEFPIVYTNANANILLNPLWSTENLKDSATTTYLRNFLRFENAGVMETLRSALTEWGSITDHAAKVVNYDDTVINLQITANLIHNSGKDYFVFYLRKEGDEGDEAFLNPDSIVQLVIQAANNSPTVEEGINRILNIAGNYADVSRAYIFEELPDGIGTRNSYEWCSSDVEPAIQDLQYLKRSDYNYDVIISAGVYITDDIRDLPQMDFEVLDSQGIKALAILTLYQGNRGIGYVGFDDCKHYRKWSEMEIQTLKYVSSVLASLIERRNAEASVMRSLNILTTISDNIDSIIYVTDIHTHEIKFINSNLANSLGMPADQILGQTCWKVMQRGMNGLCDFCPLKNMLDADGNVVNYSYTWEFKNTVTNKWYLVKDAIITWIDGQEVHIETATDITRQKEQEEQLRYYASIDTMTGTYNREWGYKIINEFLSETENWLNPQPVSLCFVDLDGLKTTNDTYGHDAGDDMITTIIQTMRAKIRKTDIICRWGGDEFILLLRCETDVAEKIMQSVMDALEEINQSGAKRYHLDLSYGIIALNATPSGSIDSVISAADAKMYKQKAEKKARQGKKNER